MNGQKQAKAHGTNLTSYNDLQRITEEQLRTEGAKIVIDAEQGIQTAIIADDGRVRAVVGLNCVRYLPNADPDPLEEIAWEAFESDVENEKK